MTLNPELYINFGLDTRILQEADYAENGSGSSSEDVMKLKVSCLRIIVVGIWDYVY